MNMVLALLRQQYPERNFIDDVSPQKLCPAIIGDEDRLLGLLKRWGGRHGWIPLEQSMRDAISLEP
jgi:hypothetical protein